MIRKPLNVLAPGTPNNAVAAKEPSAELDAASRVASAAASVSQLRIRCCASLLIRSNSF
jgi:hypothetical protein